MLPPVGLAEEYFRTYAEGAKKKDADSWYGGCPICHEGNSWGVKHRLFYTPSKGLLHCHNCNGSWDIMQWMMEVSGKTFKEIKREFNNFEYVNSTIIIPRVKKESKNDAENVKNYDLPYGTIDITNQRQIKYYGYDPIVYKAVEYIKSRRLDTCHNKINYGFTKRDFMHKNRIVIPFKDFDGHTIFYQTRKIGLQTDDPDSPKYLSKDGSPKSVFGIDHVEPEIRNLYITEGPIDSCFIPNGISMAGLVMSGLQEEQISRFFLFGKIWVLDNDFRKNPDVLAKYVELIKRGERVFIWPKEFEKYKDINDVCVDKKLDFLATALFDRFSFYGTEAGNILKDAVHGKY